MTNKELYTRCLELSYKIREYRNQFIALLPEVAARELYLEHGMHSVYEFASKLAGLSHDTVRKVLKLNVDLGSSPVLKEKFLKGEISVEEYNKAYVSYTVAMERAITSESNYRSSKAYLEELLGVGLEQIL